MTNKLKLIGFWHSFFEDSFPDPAWFVDNNWDLTEKAKVIAHLKSGQIKNSWMGSSWCRFRCGNKSLGAADLSDGKYIWPEGLVHYIENHGVRLPQQFVEHVLNSTNNAFASDVFEIDSAWWLEQKGWNANQASFKDVLDIGLLKITQMDSAKKEIQKKYLLDFLGQSYGITGRQKSVDEVINGAEISVKGRFRDIANFVINAREIGLTAEFVELTSIDYL